MSASFANSTNRSKLCDSSQDVTSQVDEKTMQRASRTQSLPTNRTQVDRVTGTDLAGEEASQTLRSSSRAATNELKNEGFAKMSGRERACNSNELDDRTANQKSLAIGEILRTNASRASATHDEQPEAAEQSGYEQDFDDQLEALNNSIERASNSTNNKQIEYDEDAADAATNDTSTSASASNQSVELESLVAPDLDLDLNRRAGHQQANLFAALGSPLTSELRRLRQSGVKKVQQALRSNRGRRRRRKPTAGQHKKRETTSLPMALIKSMQTRQGLMSGGSNFNGNVQSTGSYIGSSDSTSGQSSALMKQLAAVNPLKQQLASGSMQISTAIQRLLASKFGSALTIGNNRTSQPLRTGNELMLHNNNHLLASVNEDQAAGGGGDYSATSATSSSGSRSTHLNNLLAMGQLEGSPSPLSNSLGGHTDNNQAAAGDFFANMQTHHQQQRPQSPSNLAPLEDDTAPGGHSLLADYQSAALSPADRLVELMGQWSGQQQEQQHALQQPDSTPPINAGRQDDALKLSQLVAAATAAAAAATGQSAPPAATNKQLIPIEIIGLDPSVTNSILYGPVGGHEQQQQARPMKQQQQELLDETSGGATGPAAASELDVQENPQHFQAPAPLRHHRHPPIDQAPTAYADSSQTGGESSSDASAGQEPAGDSSQASGGEKATRQKPSSVLHIHHFHHTQPASSGLVEQQQQQQQQSAIELGAGATAGSNSETGEQPEGGPEQQQQAGESGKEAESQQVIEELAGQQKPRASKVLRTSITGEPPRVVLVSGAGSGPAPNQENAQEEPQKQDSSAWPIPNGDIRGQPVNQIESGPEEADGEQAGKTAPVNAKKMRFVTRNSLRQRQQQQPQPGYQNLTYANSHHAGAYSPASAFNPEQQIIVNNQHYELERPVMSRPQGNQRYNAMLSRRPGPPARPPPFSDLLNPANSEQTDPQQALSDAPESQGMLMVAYRPTGTIVSTSGDGSQLLAPLYVQNSYNRTFPSTASGQHNTYIRQTPYNEGSESKTPSQLLFHRPHSNSSQLLMRPQVDNYASSSGGSRVPSPNLLKNLMKQPKMNQALLMHQLHASNQSASPYWSNEDERLLAQFNLANGPGQLKIAQANLIQMSNRSLDAYTNHFIDSQLPLSRSNHTIGSSPQLMQQLQLPPTVEQHNTSQRLTSDELAQVMREQAVKQLHSQNQLKQQQQAQVASLLLNNLSGGSAASASSPLLSKIVGLSGNGSTNDGLLPANGNRNGRFELTMASDRSPSKFPVSRNASATSGNNVRMTKHFHVPDTGLHEKGASKSLESDLEQSTKVSSSAGGALEHSVHVQASTPTKQTGQHQVDVDNILDSAHGLGNLALGFIFFVSLMSFLLILVSLIYRRQRAVGSARCGPSTMRRDDADSSSQPKGGPMENGGRKSLRCFNNLTQRTRDLMRSNFSGCNSTSNVIAGSTPLSSLKSLNQLDSSITFDSHQTHAENHRAAASKAMQMASPQNGRASGRARLSKYSCPDQSNSVAQTKMSTFNMNSRLISKAQHSGIEKYSAPETGRVTSGEHPSNPDIRTLNTRLQKNAYLQKALAASAATSNHEHSRSSISSRLGLPAHQPARPLGKKHQQYNRASPASIEMPQTQAKYVNTQVQLKNANL